MNHLVNLFIIGTVKGGTTWLAKNFDQTPQVRLLDIKEPHYFSGLKSIRPHIKHVLGAEEYHSLIADSVGHDECMYICDASATYLESYDAPLKLYEYNPDAKIVALLRNPVERAYSQFLMDVREGYLPYNASFDDVLHSDICNGKEGRDSRKYYELGEYFDALERYERLFGENFLVLHYSELADNSEVLLNKAFNFLGIDNDDLVCDERRYNSYSKPKNRFSSWVLGNDLVRPLVSRILPENIKSKLKGVFIDKFAVKPCLDVKTYDDVFSLYEKDQLKLKTKYGKRWLDSLNRK